MDGKNFLANTIEIMENDTALQRCYKSRRSVPIKVSKFTPVGNEYPQITLWLDEGSSETIFPAGWYKFEVTVWLDKNTTVTPYAVLRTFIYHINRICNRKASSLSDIDITDNEGLRVARCVKEEGEIHFVRETGKWFGELCYGCVISEGESFDPDDAGNKAWV